MIPIGVIAAARTAAGGGSGHRYWRWTGFAWSGDRVEISELRVVNGSTPIAADMTSSSSPSYYGLYYLTDGSFGAGCTWWSPAGLWIVADLGSPQEVTGMQIGSDSTPSRYPTDVTLQYADSDAGPWTTFGVWSGLTYPGNYTAGPVLTPSAYVTSGHRYWQIVGVTVAGDYLQISELQLLVSGTVVSAGITPTSSHTPISYTLADLVDGQLAVDQITWTRAVAQDPGFYVRFDLGAAQAVTGVRQAGGDTDNRYMSAFTLQYADSPSGPWTDYGSEVGLAYPGNYTLSEVYDMVPTPTAYVTDGLVFMLDPSSYSSGQMWGSAPYDFHLGASSSAEASDPTHNGTYWTFDGGDNFTAASAATTFLKDMHKVGSEFTIEAWWYYAGGGPNVHPIFDSGTSDQGGSDMSRGVIFGDMGYLDPPAAGSFGFRVKRDFAAGTALSVYLTSPLTTGWHHLAVSYQQGAGAFLWVDGATASTNLGATTWDGTLSSPGTTDPANAARIGARGDVAYRVVNGSRLGILRIYDSALSQTEMLQNWNADRATYGL